MRETIARLMGGDPVENALRRLQKELVEAGFDSVDYADLRRGADLQTTREIGMQQQQLPQQIQRQLTTPGPALDKAQLVARRTLRHQAAQPLAQLHRKQCGKVGSQGWGRDEVTFRTDSCLT